jgi:hypothetical protein
VSSGTADTGGDTDSDAGSFGSVGGTDWPVPTSTTANPTLPGTVTVTTSVDTGTDSTTTGTLPEGIYVHAALGADSNPGTPDEPVRTVQLGVELAAAQGLPIRAAFRPTTGGFATRRVS